MWGNKKKSMLIFHLKFFFFVFLIFNLSTASDTIHHKSISNKTNYVMVSYESKGKGRSFPMLTVLPPTFRNENEQQIISFKEIHHFLKWRISCFQNYAGKNYTFQMLYGKSTNTWDYMNS